jgi:hypothetical protein
MTSIATALKGTQLGLAGRHGIAPRRFITRNAGGTAIYRLIRWAQRNAVS